MDLCSRNEEPMNASFHITNKGRFLMLAHSVLIGAFSYAGMYLLAKRDVRAANDALFKYENGILP